MNRWVKTGALCASIAFALGCDEQTEVQRQTNELAEAQKNVGKVTEELTTDLEKAKADVLRLEQKIALARQGLTDDVLENQKELQEALKAQEHKVQTEQNEAAREAQIHDRDTEGALKVLGQGNAAPTHDPALQTAQGTSTPGTEGEVPAHGEMVPVKGADPTPPEPQMPAPVPANQGVTERSGIPDTANPNSYYPAPSASPPAAPASPDAPAPVGPVSTDPPATDVPPSPAAVPPAPPSP